MTATQTPCLLATYAGVPYSWDSMCNCSSHSSYLAWNSQSLQATLLRPQFANTNPSVKVIPKASDYTMMTLEKRRGTIPPTWTDLGRNNSHLRQLFPAQSLPFILDSQTQTKDIVIDIPTKATDTCTQPNTVPREPGPWGASVSLAKIQAAPAHASAQSTPPSANTDAAPRRRVKDDEGFIRRAACVCVNEDESKVLLISSKTDGRGWLIPGGGLEDGEQEEKAAIREGWEEAGVRGCIRRWLGRFQSEDEQTKKKKRTSVFVLKVHDQANVFPESDLGRRRQWFQIDEAKEKLSISKPNQIPYLEALHSTSSPS